MVRVLASIGLAIAVTSGPLAQPSTNPAQANKSIASYVYLVNAEGDKILVYDRMGNGNVAPKRAIEGPDAGRGLDALAIDPVNDWSGSFHNS